MKHPVRPETYRKSADLVSLKVFALTVLIATSPVSSAQELIPGEVIATLKRSADWQIANRTEQNLNGWIIAPFYDGLLRTADATGDANYLAEVLDLADAAHWAPGTRTYHADDHAVGHAWVDIFLIDQTKAYRLTRTENRLDRVIANPITEALEFGKPVTTPGVRVTDRWTWCDALYMAPPTLARLYSATGDTTYLDFLKQEYLYTYNLLYDSAEGVFYRDSRYIDDLTPNGKKVFWSRGNGWVYGGLALLLDYLPQDHEDRPFYEGLFQDMTVAVIAAQQSDGLWRPSLADPDHIPVGETSGSGFFTFGLAWGINNGLLDRATYWPVAEAGWRGLLTRLGTNGLVGYVQQPGAAPAAFTATSTREYGTGAFLLAGSEVLRAIGGAASIDPAVLLAAAEDIRNPPLPSETRMLVNLSTRLSVGPGDVGIQGFVAGGTGEMRVLVRAVGPGLSALGVPGAMPDPQLTLYEGSTPIAGNNDWDPDEIGDAFELTGAFPFAIGSRDAALVVTIEPGKLYTAHVRGDDGGIVLIEAYDVPAE